MKYRTVFFLIVFFIQNIIAIAQNEQELDVLIFNGKYFKAIEKAKSILKKNPNSASVCFKTAKVYLNLNKYKNSENYFRKAVELDTQNISYKVQYAENLYVNGEKEKAILILKQVLEKDSLSFQALNRLVKIYFKEKKYKKAQAIYDRLIEKDSLNTYYYRKAGFCAQKQKKKADAESYYLKAFQIDSSEIINIKNLSNFYLKTAKYDKALSVAGRGIELDSTLAYFHLVKAMAYYHKNHYYRAVPEFNKVIELGDSSLALSKLQGFALFKTFNFEESYKCLQNVYKSDSTDFKVTLFLGRTCYELKKDKESIFYLDKTLELLQPPKSVLSTVYEIKSKDFFAENKYYDALKMQKAKIEHSNTVKMNDYYYLGLIYDKINKRKKAIANYEKYLKEADEIKLNGESNKQYQFVKQRISRMIEYLHFHED